MSKILHQDKTSERKQQIQRLQPWFHNLHFDDGLQTAPDHFLGDFPAYKWRELSVAIPQDLRGWSALDIGCNAGYYSFELAKRGAQVTAVDSNPHYLDQARWAAQIYGLSDSIRFECRQVHELAYEKKRYDMILFLGVFYHLRYPLLALDTVCRKVDRLLVFQSLTMGEADSADTHTPEDLDFDQRNQFCGKHWPHMAFIEKSFNHDPTNWWVPNASAVEAMLRSSGMRIVHRPGTETYLCEPDEQSRDHLTSWCLQEYEAATGRSNIPE